MGCESVKIEIDKVKHVGMSTWKTETEWKKTQEQKGRKPLWHVRNLV